MTKERSTRSGEGLAMGMCIGVAIGTALGVAMDDLAIGMPLGISLGVMLGVAMEPRDARRTRDRSKPTQPGGDGPEDTGA
jgi:uncharacterized membrane protein YoaK (UPF0700 family)